MEVISKDGDMVDQLALQAYGQRNSKTTAMVIKANPGLSALPVRLPAGVRIVIPPMGTETAQDRRVRLWD